MTSTLGTTSWFDESTNPAAATVKFTGADFSNVVPQQGDKKRVKDIGHLEDIRKPRAARQTTDEVFQSLIDVILTAKKDITRINGLDDYETAKEYAKKRNLRIAKEETDVNHDGVNDVILYNKQGKPVIVNGYKLTPSKQPLRKMYQKAKREGNLWYPDAGMSGFTKQLYGLQSVEFDDNGEREVPYDNKNLPEDLQHLKNHHWSIPSAPTNKLSAHQQIMKFIRDAYNGVFRATFEDENKLWINGALPRFKLFDLVYTQVVDGELWKLIPQKDRITILNKSGGDPGYAYRLYKEYKDSARVSIRNILKSNLEALKAFNWTFALGQMLDNIGARQDVIVGLDIHDDDFKKYEKDNAAEQMKNQLKMQWANAADRCKEHLIDTLFVPQQGDDGNGVEYHVDIPVDNEDE